MLVNFGKEGHPGIGRGIPVFQTGRTSTPCPSINSVSDQIQILPNCRTTPRQKLRKLRKGGGLRINKQLPDTAKTVY